MPFPDSTYDGTRILAIFCPEFTFFAIAYLYIPLMLYNIRN
jgi:hypothetical protein